MKILLTNHFPLEGSGSGIYTQNVALELTKLGHDVTCILPENQPVPEYPFRTKAIYFKAPVDPLPNTDLPFNFPCFTTHPRSNYTYYEMNQEQIAAYKAAFDVAIDEHIAEHGCDFIHAQHLWIVSTCAIRTGIPAVATCHGTDLMGYAKDARFHSDVDELIEKVGGVVCISGQVRDDAMNNVNVPEAKARLIHNGFNSDIFKPLASIKRDDVLAEFGVSGDGVENVVTFVGKLTEFKGIDVLIKAAATYEKELPGTVTLIVGFGQLHEQLNALCREVGAANVHFLGHQPQTSVCRLYNIADVSTVPSRIEPFGLVAVEALATGTPVVATDAGGLPDFINGDVGALVPMEDPQALAAAIIAEISGGTKKTKGAYAAQYALEKLSWTVQTKKMEAYYHEVLASS